MRPEDNSGINRVSQSIINNNIQNHLAQILAARLPFPSVPRICRVPAAFFPGLRVSLPFSFLAAPSILSFRCGLRWWCVAGCVVPVIPWPRRRPVVVVVVCLVFRLRSGSVEMFNWMRGFECPVDERVNAISAVQLCYISMTQTVS